MIYYNNDKTFWFWLFMQFVMFYLFFLKEKKIID